MLVAAYVVGVLLSASRALAISNYYRSVLYPRSVVMTDLGNRTDIVNCVVMSVFSWVGWLVQLDGPPEWYRHDWKLRGRK